MPLDGNEIEDLASSADPAPLDAQPDLPVVDAESSPATEGEEDSLLSVVRNVVTESRKSDPVSPAEGEAEGIVPAAKTAGTEDYSDVPFSAHPRFKELIREKNAYKADVQRYQPEAEKFREVIGFMDQNGLSPDEAAELLTIGGLMKTNPAEAVARITPALQRLFLAAGEVLSDDLKGMVQRQEMSVDAALEVSRARAAVQANHATRSFEQQRAEQARYRETESALKGAAEAWQSEREKKDPGFVDKLEPLMDRIARMQRQEGVPNTPQGVRDQLNRAYQGLVASRPRAATAGPRPIKPVMGGQVAGTPQPQPQTMLDIVRANRRSA